jgi:hypothetical protein
MKWADGPTMCFLSVPSSSSFVHDGYRVASETWLENWHAVDGFDWLMRFRLNPAQTEITSGEVVEQASERLGDLTHVIGLNGWFYVTANVGWSKVDDHGQLKPGEPPLLLRFREPSVSSVNRGARPKSHPMNLH